MTSNQRGFTLIELLLAMTFISFMLLFSTNTVIQVTRLSTKGSAIRQINQTGRQVLEDLSSVARYAPPVFVASKNRLCVGGTSYLWNAEGQAVNAYTLPDSGTPIRLISRQDASGSLCSPPFNPVSKSGSKDLVGSEVTVMQFSVTQSANGSLLDVVLVLSTAGSNRALPDPTTPTGFACDPGNQFCAFGDFETTIYSRTRGN